MTLVLPDSIRTESPPTYVNTLNTPVSHPDMHLSYTHCLSLFLSFSLSVYLTHTHAHIHTHTPTHTHTHTQLLKQVSNLHPVFCINLCGVVLWCCGVMMWCDVVVWCCGGVVLWWC